jgi:hypothetical protein
VQILFKFFQLLTIHKPWQKASGGHKQPEGKPADAYIKIRQRSTDVA